MTAIVQRAVNPADRTPSVDTDKIPTPSTLASNTNKKRKERPDPAPIPASQSFSANQGNIYVDEEEDPKDVADEDPLEELYAVLDTQVVGIQYYTGIFSSTLK